jgi:hypothetical protein
MLPRARCNRISGVKPDLPSRKFRLQFFLAVLCGPVAINPPAIANDRMPVCAIPHREKTAGRAFYVDPLHGSMANDGSAARPWSTLHDVFAHHLISTASYATPYAPGAGLHKADPSAPIHAGDTIYLRAGDHGEVTLRGVNDDFITIAAAPGEKPVIDRLLTQGASKWILRILTIRNHGGELVELRDDSFYGPSDNIILESSTLYSEVAVNAWSAADWRKLAANGILDDAPCSILRGNLIFNVGGGIGISAPHSIVEKNVIENFGDDGIDFTAGGVAILDNYVADNHDIGDGNHNDGIQGWTFDPAGEKDVVISGNTLIDETVPGLPMRGVMQGITIFDGKWSNVSILDNYVRTDAWHGIALYGARDSRIDGNTVVGDGTASTWIMVTDMKKEQGGRSPSNDIVRRNVATRFNLPGGGQVSASDNVVLGSEMMVPPG